MRLSGRVGRLEQAEKTADKAILVIQELEDHLISQRRMRAHDQGVDGSKVAGAIRATHWYKP